MIEEQLSASSQWYENQILCGDALETLTWLPDESVDMCLTSPPYYGLRNYGVDGQLGLNQSVSDYIAALIAVCDQVHRVLKHSGTFWLNLGDSYAGSGKGRFKGGEVKTEGMSRKQVSNQGSVGGVIPTTSPQDGAKPKDLLGIPWRIALALRDRGWYLRQDIVWHKPNAMPESVKDRCTRSHEYLFLLSKDRAYYFNHEAIREDCAESSVRDFKRRKTMDNKGGGQDSFEDVRPDLCRSRADYYAPDFKRSCRDTWIINTRPYRGAHFATFPEKLAERCVLAGCPENGIVLDSFMGAGTSAVAAIRQGKRYVGIELNPAYIALAEERIRSDKY